MGRAQGATPGTWGRAFDGVGDGKMAGSVAVAGRSQHLLLARPRVSECEEVVLALVETVSVLVGQLECSLRRHRDCVNLMRARQILARNRDVAGEVGVGPREAAVRTSFSAHDLERPGTPGSASGWPWHGIWHSACWRHTSPRRSTRKSSSR
jgi:hypothetical protein